MSRIPLVFFLIVLGFTVPAAATEMLAGEVVTYKDGDTVLEGYLVRAAHCSQEQVCKPVTGDAPVVMIVHQWKGLGGYEKGRADMLARQGYHAFAVDMYGQGIRPRAPDEAGREAGKYKSDPALARRRMKAALDYARTIPGTTGKVAVIGYCFGGTMALELARSGADLDGAVSFHGGLSTKAPAEKGSIHGPLQIHHGAADPHVAPDEVAAFTKEMTAANADLMFYSYPDAVHSFTEREAGDDPSKGAAYNQAADETSWKRTTEFLDKVLK